MAAKPKVKDELLALANIGPAMRRDFKLLGIDTVAHLARQDADKLYLKLSALTGHRQDPCVWDTFAAAIHQAKTGEAKPWWDWTAVRKKRASRGEDVTAFRSGRAAAAPRRKPDR
jgi:hypothetical protein